METLKVWGRAWWPSVVIRARVAYLVLWEVERETLCRECEVLKPPRSPMADTERRWCCLDCLVSAGWQIQRGTGGMG